MSAISSVSTFINWESFKEQKISVKLRPEIRPPEEVVHSIASLKGPTQVICWYGGPEGLFRKGAEFMRDNIFNPLQTLKKDLQFSLYSLEAWGFKQNIEELDRSTVDRIQAFTFLNSATFFHYCVSNENPLYAYVQQELPKKSWLKELSAPHKELGKKVQWLFANKSSLFDCLADQDCQKAYSQMQNIEGYWLIREAVERALSNRQSKLQLVFALPNNEADYFLDFPACVPTMLRLDFGDRLAAIEVDVSFEFFKYKNNLKSRPYSKQSNDSIVQVAEIGKYLGGIENEKEA